MVLFFCILGIIGNILVLVSCFKKRSIKIGIIGIIILYVSLIILGFIVNLSVPTIDYSNRPIPSNVVSEEKWPSLPH